jgi:hypothetical protein
MQAIAGRGDSATSDFISLIADFKFSVDGCCRTGFS